MPETIVVYDGEEVGIPCLTLGCTNLTRGILCSFCEREIYFRDIRTSWLDPPEPDIDPERKS